MANAIRLIAVERGLDTRDFALIAFGGAGPLHARAVAERLGMKTVIIPPYPGLCSAFGAAIAEARVDRFQTFFTHSEGVDFDALGAALKRLRNVTVAELRASVEVDDPVIRSSADMRYAGQNYEIEVALPAGEMDQRGWDETMARFADAHNQLYGFTLPGEPVELINLRVTALSPEPPSSFKMSPKPGRAPACGRKVWFDGKGPVDCAVFPRARLVDSAAVDGPAVVEEADSTTVVFPGDQIRLDPSGVMVLTLGGRA
jgi:N-methylhydantoinase A/oxoprolinase/acetone carboxylase beta subunit